MTKNSAFEKSSTIASIIVAIIGVVGIYFKPENAVFMLFGITVIMIVITAYEKFLQVDENTDQISEIKKSIKIEQKISKIERDVYEIKGKLSMVKK